MQKAVFEHIAWRGEAGVAVLVDAQCGEAIAADGSRAEAQGMTAGVGDVSMVSPTGRYHELELKTEQWKALCSPAQAPGRAENLRGDLCDGLRFGRSAWPSCRDGERSDDHISDTAGGWC